MTTESSRGVCKYCGSPWHRGWQCKENPKNIVRISKPISPKPKSSPVSCKGSKRRSKTQTKTSRSNLIKRYDTLFSKYLRLKAQQNNALFCYTCGKRLTYETAVVMHYISRRFVSTRFDEDNVHIGCRKCNTPDIDQPKVLERYAQLLGEETVKRLNDKKQQRISTVELEAEYEALRQQYNLLLKESDSK